MKKSIRQEYYDMGMDAGFEKGAEQTNKYRAQYEKLREGLQNIIDKANRDNAKVKVIYLVKLLLDNE